MRALAVFAAVCCLTVSSAHAATRRLAVIVGNNAGAEQRPPLRYAETDAAKMARVLSEVGDVAPADQYLVIGGSVSDVQAAFAQVRQKVAEAQRTPDGRAVVLFYFSGHGDGEGLELGPEPLTFAELKALLQGTGALVRLAVIDACQSGSALRGKGGKPAAPFAIQIADQLSARGEVFITSSAADESALESSEVKGSLFTHFFVSGLRGAADVSGDKQVTLAEAYRYAFDRTVSATAALTANLQHPSYDYRLTGSGELVLAQLSTPGATLELPTGADRALVFDAARDQVVAELLPGSGRELALAAGEYGVRLNRGGEVFGGRFRLVDGTRQAVRWEDLSRVEALGGARKGGEVSADVSAHGGRLIGFLLGGARGVADDQGLQAAARVFFEPTPDTGPSFALLASSGAGWASSVSETSVQLRAGYRAVFPAGPFLLSVGAEAGPGIIWQSAKGATSGWSLAGVLGPRAAARLRVSERASVSLEGDVPIAFVQLDGAVRPVLLPSIALGAAFSL